MEFAIRHPKTPQRGFLVGIVVALLSTCATAADMDKHFFSAVLQYGIVFPPDRWVPVRMEFLNRTDEPVEGFGQLPVKNEAGGVEFRLPLVVPPRSRVTSIVYGYFPESPFGIGNAPEDRVPPIAMAEWHSNAGSWLARSEILARHVKHNPGGEASLSQVGMPQTLLLAVSNRDGSEDRDSYDSIGFTDVVSNEWGSWIANAMANETDLPREAFGYDSCQAVMLDATDPDAIDQAQRETLRGYLASGGILIVTAPLDNADLAGSWLAEYSPVQIIGHRQMNQILPSGDAKPLKFREWVGVSEAIPSGGPSDHILLQDGEFVHAVRRPIGRGYIIFTSFPINALDPNDARTTQLWMSLLNLNQPQSSWHYSALALERDAKLQSMMGLPAPPWSLAASIAGGYVAVIVLLQLFVGGARRPGAFISAVVAALLISGGLLVANQVLRRDQKLAGARIAMIELGPTGGGMQHEAFAYAGEDLNVSVVGSNADTALRPIRTSSPPQIQERPFRTTLSVHQGKIGSIWQSSAPVAENFRIGARGVFGPDGLKVTVNNEIGGNAELESPLLIWGNQRFSLPSMPAGESSATASAGNRNLRDDFKNASTVFTSEASGLRGEILAAAVTYPQRLFTNVVMEPQPELAGWLSDAATPRLFNLKLDSAPPMQTQTLARTPVILEPSPVGTRVAIDGAFNRMVVLNSPGLPYQPGEGTWIETQQSGEWLLGFAAPSGVGQLKTNKAIVRLDIGAPQHKLTLRKGQCAGGVVSLNRAGEIAGEWANTRSQHTVDIECSPDDVDANGWLWLLIGIDSSPIAAGATLTPRWKFEDFAVSYEAEVIGAPRAPVLPTEPKDEEELETESEESEPEEPESEEAESEEAPQG